jgi:16S rRNA (cytosine967-C5)-methyltransferase
VQDAGAQRAARLLDLHDGLRVLDACAAPGGKTAHILEQADVELLALDADAGRAVRVSENLFRLGLRPAWRPADCRDLDAWWDGRAFDRILADVPCSASGVVRRHPDIKWLRRERDIARFAAPRRKSSALWRVLAPGGKLLYATCSVFPRRTIARSRPSPRDKKIACDCRSRRARTAVAAKRRT